MTQPRGRDRPGTIGAISKIGIVDWPRAGDGDPFQRLLGALSGVPAYRPGLHGIHAGQVAVTSPVALHGHVGAV
ncbi:MAG: hypothetical protein CMP08_02525 [Xanthomonadales bacterium]|nr:hypothetical protein [Xanthomonadales bacterium]|tara:strand:- start:954 stop:1175 length:222 start_codon:yes stop_codon:yes gene_type:complete